MCSLQSDRATVHHDMSHRIYYWQLSSPTRRHWSKRWRRPYNQLQSTASVSTLNIFIIIFDLKQITSHILWCCSFAYHRFIFDTVFLFWFFLASCFCFCSGSELELHLFGACCWSQSSDERGNFVVVNILSLGHSLLRCIVLYCENVVLENFCVISHHWGLALVDIEFFYSKLWFRFQVESKFWAR